MDHSTFRPVITTAAGALAAFIMSAAVLFGPFAASPAFAAQPGYYSAELAQPLAEPRQEILSGVVWKCAGSTCTGSKSGSRAVIVCGRLAGKMGAVTRFADAEGELDAESLARCNKG
jgi:hypothetical protein